MVLAASGEGRGLVGDEDLLERGLPLQVRLTSGVPGRVIETVKELRVRAGSDTGRSIQEELVFSWFTDLGDYESSFTYGEDRTNVLVAREAGGTAQVHVAVRDGRGGFDVFTRTVELRGPTMP